MSEQEKMELARVLLMHAVHGIFAGCGNSYADSYTEQWLTHAKSLGAYHGRTTGEIGELEREREDWLNEHGLPDWPDCEGDSIHPNNPTKHTPTQHEIMDKALKWMRAKTAETGNSSLTDRDCERLGLLIDFITDTFPKENQDHESPKI